MVRHVIDLDPQARDESTVKLLGRLALVEELLGAAWATWRYQRSLLGVGSLRAQRRVSVAMRAASRAIRHYEHEANVITAELQRRRCRVTLEDLPDRGTTALNRAVMEWLG